MSYVLGFKWFDNLRSVVREGGKWIHEYKVDLYEVATFTLIPASDKRGEKNAGVR
jgi:hypothetical protein